MATRTKTTSDAAPTSTTARADEPDPIAWVVLREPGDVAADWAADALGRELEAPVASLGPVDLLCARIEHRITTHGGSVVFRLRDGRTLDSRTIRGGLNRAIGVPPRFTRRFVEEDREYAHQEAYAALVAALDALTPNLLNPPDPLGLPGRWRPPSEWRLLAEAAGLPVTPHAEAVPGPSVADPRPPDAYAFVVRGRVVLDAALPGALEPGCRALAGEAGEPLLGVHFERLPRGWRFRDAHVASDLRRGGEPLVRALARSLLEGAP